MAWTLKDVEALAAGGKIRGFKATGKRSSTDRLNTSRPCLESSKPCKKPDALQHIENTLQAAGIPYVTEYRFHPVRKFKFDIAIPEKMVAIEYEGLMSKKSRHTTIKGYTTDATKYNLAQQLGWRVFRYTVLNYKEFTIESIQVKPG